MIWLIAKSMLTKSKMLGATSANFPARSTRPGKHLRPNGANDEPKAR